MHKCISTLTEFNDEVSNTRENTNGLGLLNSVSIIDTLFSNFIYSDR